MDAAVAIDGGERRLPHSSPALSVINAQRHASECQRGSSQSDGRDAHTQTPPQHHLQPRSSPAAASVDSFSSYINKDAALFQNRSSSPRADDQLRDNSDPASQTTSSPRPQPRHLVTTPIVSRDAFRHQPWLQHDLPRSASSVMSIEHLHNDTNSQLPRHQAEHAVDDHVDVGTQNHRSPETRIEMAAHTFHGQRVTASPSPAIDVNRLSMSNLAQKNQQDDVEDSVYGDSMSVNRGPASVLADDSFDSTASVVGEDSKNEIRRRRRTRPDEANLLAQVYAKNPFPDHETRLFLANRVGMSVRAVSVWFQNRRQAEKKRSGRYGGAGIAPTSSVAGDNADIEATTAAEDAPATILAPVVALAQRKPLGNASANGAAPAKHLDPQSITDLSSNNKENIPPWLNGLATEERVQQRLEKIKREAPQASLSKEQVLAPRQPARDLRQAVGPEGVGIAVHRVQVDRTVPEQPATAEAAVISSSKSSLSRHRSVPRLSLDDVLSGRSKSLRRSATEHAGPLIAASSEPEQEQLDTILPPPKVLSRASSSSSLSLLTTSGGRASIGSLGLRHEAPVAASSEDVRPSLTSSLPPKLTAALQRQGIIAMHPDADGQKAQGQGLLQMMPSSSASSSEADALYSNDQRRDHEEDEERTLKMIAQRRAAKAQAAALAKAQEARERAASGETPERAGVVGLAPLHPGCADARQAIVQQAGLLDSSALVGSTPKSGTSTVVGLGPARQLSLDWAAGRDRAATSALPKSIGGTPLSRSVSARQLTMPQPNESTPLTQQRNAKLSDSAPTNGEKRKADAGKAGRRSLSATDLTRRLQQAKRKGDAAQRSVSAGRKRSAAVAAALEAGDENVDPSAATDAAAAGAPAQNSAGKQSASPVKRRRAQLEDIVLASSLAEPAVSSKATAPFGVGMGAPISPLLSSRPFLPHASFPSASRTMPTMVVPSTPQNSSLYTSSGIPLSTRSDRFRAIGASPAGSLGRSISANYTSHRQLPRSSAARDHTGPNRNWNSNAACHIRTFSNNDEGWTPRSNGGGGSMSQPLPASTPSRVLGDRTNFASTPAFHHHSSHHRVLPGNSSGDSPFAHDDSGFFEGMSDDDDEPREQIKISPRKASLRSMRAPGAESGDDRQAAELLLGLGKVDSSRDSSSSQ
ncbi:homeodomain transcription factor [Pseudozyma hubeiensis SY62]|uniref:Homeodomain transcription factor n=1 Tax=Pseudozyma hubeiensis (strain SY62) TaxID=1305764 RepID=R9PC12_PSEHS|nr:homeodomain transcription factor [Pseudozyma hubeiensis SY62]GAC95625.1 homeodomain transcription factor [Pseudozyma hubeiensis SY62]